MLVMPSSKNKFTTSGLLRPGVQNVTRKTFPSISSYELEFLKLNPDYSRLLHEIEGNFFAWIMENRRDGKQTTPYVKRMKYKSIAEKHLSAIKDGPGLFGSLKGLNAPQFQCVDDSCAMSGVIPFLHNPIILSCSNPTLFSRPPVSCEVSQLQPDLPSFPAVSMTFPPPQHSYEDVMSEQEKEFFFATIVNPDVVDTLREIAEIHKQISLVCNTPNLDASLEPSDWFNQKYPGSPLSLISKSEQ